MYGKEYGEAGSFEYVKRYIEHQTSRYKGCVNMDLVGNSDRLYYIKNQFVWVNLFRTMPF